MEQSMEQGASIYVFRADTEGEWEADDVTKLRPGDIPYADIWTFGFSCQDYAEKIVIPRKDTTSLQK